MKLKPTWGKCAAGVLAGVVAGNVLAHTVNDLKLNDTLVQVSNQDMVINHIDSFDARQTCSLNSEMLFVNKPPVPVMPAAEFDACVKALAAGNPYKPTKLIVTAQIALERFAYNR